MNDVFLKSLKEKEVELFRELEGVPVFKQLEALRSTISIFQNSEPTNGIHNSPEKMEVPLIYNDEELTWKSKILYVINKLGNSFVSEIVTELQKLGSKHPKDFLDKRVGVTVSQLKKSGAIGAQQVGKKGRYFIK